MTTQRRLVVEARPLDILGITEMEELAYQCLLAHPRATAREISHVLRLSLRKTQRLLDTIEAKGLVTHSPERSRKYIPASPDIAIEAIILQRQNDLQNARTRVQELQQQAAVRRHGEQEQTIELITSRDAERQALEQMQSAAQHEVLSLVRPPMRVSKLTASYDEDQHVQRSVRARGVHYRGIVDAEFLALPGGVDRIRGDVESNEEIRVFPHLPFKMVLADRRIALIPLNLQEPDSPVLLVRSSALLDALFALFEILWARSTPLLFTRGGAMETLAPNARLSKEVEDVLSLLIVGMNDKAIALELNISTRTLERRIVELMENLDARTRFQAGWLAAQRFSLGSDS